MRKLFIAITAVMSLWSASAEVTYKYDSSTKTLTLSGTGITNVTVASIMEDDFVRPDWWDYKKDAEKVVVGEGITKIGNSAFMDFKSLKSVELPSTLTSIGVASFEGCEALSDINMPANLTEFGEETFFDCKSLESVVVPKGVTKLPANMFQNCEKLKAIDLGNVKEFGKQVFEGCAFDSFVIPEGTKTLSECMFMACKNIKKIVIPASVEKLEYGVFYYCVIDTIKYLGETFPTCAAQNIFTSGALDEHTTVHVINCKAFTQEAVDAIRNHGGYYNTKIIPAWPNGVDIYSTNNTYAPLTVTPVDCDNNIYKLTVDPWSSSYQVTWTGTYDVPEADLHKTEITVDLSSPATVIAEIEYVPGGGGISTSTIYFSVTKTGMGKVDFETIEKTETSHTYKLVATPKDGYEFLYWETYNDGILTEEQETNPEIEITITETEYVKAYFTQSPYCGVNEGENIAWSIKNDTLYLTGEGEMENYKMGEESPYSSYADEFSFVKVGEGITSLGSMSFVYLDNIEEIYLPSTLTKLGDYVFTYCQSLEKIHFAGTTPPSEFGTIVGLLNLFAETSEDLQIVVPCGSEEAYKKTFAEYSEDNMNTGDEELVELDIVCSSDENNDDDDDDDDDDDSEIPSMDDITFDPANVCGADEDGANILWAFDEATGTLYLKGEGKMKDYYATRKKSPWIALNVKNVVVGDGITTIGNYAFYGMSSVENVTLPTSLDSISDYAFASATSIKEFVVPEGVAYIGDHAFESLSGDIDLPSTLKEIGEYAFQYCQVKTVEVPESVEKIGHGAFYNSGVLEEVVLRSATPANTGGNTIVTTVTGTRGRVVKIVVPCDAVEAYKEADGYQPQYIQGEYAYTLKLTQTTDTYEGSDLGGRPMIQQWPDCETGEAIVSVIVNSPYQFSHWEATGVTLTEEESKANPITFTVDDDCILTAIFKTVSDVDDIDADGVVVMAEDGRISVNRDEFQIFNILGHDVTSANGSLATGVYVVKVNGKAYKAVVK